MRRQAQAEQAMIRRVRCALYTRKSTDENLDSEFNTLDAQREAAEAYVASQRHEGCSPITSPSLTITTRSA